MNLYMVTIYRLGDYGHPNAKNSKSLKKKIFFLGTLTKFDISEVLYTHLRTKQNNYHQSLWQIRAQLHLFYREKSVLGGVYLFQFLFMPIETVEIFKKDKCQQFTLLEKIKHCMIENGESTA